MKLIYIASPYTTGDVGKNIHLQLETAHQLLDLGFCPYTPLLNHYLHIHRPRPWQEWLAMDEAILPHIDALLRLKGESLGADREMALARKLGKPIFQSIEDLQEGFLDSKNPLAQEKKVGL